MSGGQFVQVPVAGRGGVPVGAKAVVVNVTLVAPAADGFATVFPCGSVPFTSSLNYSAGENVANEVFAKLSPTGTICVYTSATANVIVDVAGFVPAGSDLASLNPARLADTRPGWVAADGLFEGTGPVSGGQFVQVPVAGRGGVPVGAKAVVVNVTLVAPAADGFATVFPCGSVPFTSSLNYSAGENVANEVFAKLSPTGTICVYTSATANVIVDVAGFVPAGSDYTAMTPVRLADTRPLGLLPMGCSRAPDRCRVDSSCRFPSLVVVVCRSVRRPWLPMSPLLTRSPADTQRCIRVGRFRSRRV